MEHNFLHNDQDTWRILNALRQLLTPIPPSSIDAKHTTQVIVRLRETYYSLPAHCVRDIRPLGNYTPLPFTHSCIVGVVSVRGQLLVVLDIRPFLIQVWDVPRPDAMLLHVELEGMELGVLVDRVVALPRSTRNDVSAGDSGP